MNTNKEDFYITMLRYGKSKMSNSFRLEEIVEYLQKNGYPLTTENSIIMHHYFPQAFFAKTPLPYPDRVNFYYLKPEAYFHLLAYDNMEATKQSSKWANRIAIAAIVLTLLTLIISVLNKI